MNKKLIEFNNNLKNKKVAILGLGVSNIPLLDYLLDKECSVTVFNDKKIELDITKYPYTFYEDNESLKYLTNFDIIFRSPSFLPTREELAKEIKRGAYVTTEVTEVLKLCPCKVIGVTGSDGKTTTTTLIDLLLRENGYKTFLGGNIGTPLFTKINEMTENDIVVLELSSFQLMDMDVSPDISIITNITPNHLDKHKDLDEYIEAKKCIYKNKGSVLVINDDNEVTKNLTSEREVRRYSRYHQTNYYYVSNNHICFNGEYLINTNEFLIKGTHNYENMCAALTVLHDMIDLNKSLNVLKTFKGVEHRLEFVREINGAKWYNDSVSSSPTRTIAGLNTYNEDIVLIAGGYDKNLDYTPLARPILDKVKVLILMGTTKDKIKNAVLSLKKDEDIEIIVCDNLSDSVNKAYELAKPNNVVLLSPASASFDMFKNFADRGEQFKKLVSELK